MSDMELIEDDFCVLQHCPWDYEPEDYEWLYKDYMGCDVVRCCRCGAVYSKRRLNSSGLSKYWARYSSRVHTSNSDAVANRKKMYDLDFEYIHSFVQSGKVLDIGCGEGDFLDIFSKKEYETFGVEYGKEAAAISGKKHNVREGIFPDMNIVSKFDLIIFRGVLQYLPDPQNYLKKAIEITKPGGYVYITAQPNVDSFGFRLFKGKFSLAVSGADFLGYTESMLTDFFHVNGCRKVGEKYFYEETPYADVENDVLLVAKAIEMKGKDQAIDFISPAFWGNVMTLVYEKKVNYA